MNKYHFDYSENTAAGRLVGLLAAHVAPGVVVDLGCGTAELAAPLVAAGFEYVGYDLDADVVRALVARGIDARRCDLAVDDADALVEAALDGRPLAAITAIDVVEHVPGFDRLLSALSSVAARHDAVLGISIPNVAHEELATKLLAGRWDITDIGLLDATHVNLFDERRLRQAMTTAGFAETARDDVELLRTEQGLLLQHPYVHAHTNVGEWLRHLRSIASDHATTYQFVRVYRPTVPGPPFDGAPPAAPLGRPTFTVVILPGTAGDVEASRAAVSAQRRPADAVLIAPDREIQTWFVEALRTVDTTHLCLIEPGHIVPDLWLERFAAVLEHHPARVARFPVEPSLLAVGDQWGLLRTLSLRDEPLCAFAVPVAPAAWVRLADASATDALWVWLVRTACLVGFVDVVADTRLPVVPRREATDLLPTLGGTALLMPVGWHHEVAVLRSQFERLEAEAAAERQRADGVTAALGQMHDSRWWRLGAPLRRLMAQLRARRPL